MPIVRSYYRMLRRNLIYTAITRSRQFLILCGEESALRSGVQRAEEQARLTSLTKRLQDALGEAPERTGQEEAGEEAEDVPYEVKLMNADPMIGMGSITPYDFLEEKA
ncbi:helicase, RecD/TraA family [Mycobacteroides abscessus subsp. abscessus]|nr:helicase, RecD/TraA family [Mycobacteroides abscessus subsp. abscessus]